MNAWPKVALGELLRRSDETTVIDPAAEYHEVTIKLWGKGVISRGKVSGSDVVSARRVVRANQLIMSKIDARNGAIGLVPPELDGAIVSNDFPSFEFRDPDQCDAAFMDWLVRSSPFVELCKAASEGTTNRVRIKEDRFLDQQIALPPLTEQQALVARLDALAEKTRQLEAHLDAVEHDSLRLLATMATRSDIDEEQRLALGWRLGTISDIAALALHPEAVDAECSYPNVGILSYAKGVFAKAPIDGATTSAKTLYKIKSGQFIYSRLFAFEGAYALVPNEFDGCYVSNEFPTFEIKGDSVSTKFLMAHFVTKADWRELRSSTKGVGDRRLRIQPEHILTRPIWIPPENEFTRIDALFDRHFDLKTKHTAIREANAALLPATLERVFTGEH
jgi:type I restriction enzyme, S subunit